MTRAAICGEPMRRYEKPGREAIPDYLTCGRKPKHRGRHISTLALARQRDAAPQPATGSPLVAAAIHQARTEARLSKRALAAAVGVTDMAVHFYETAQRTPSAEVWQQLELTLGPLGVVRDAGPEPAAREQSDAAA